jgi:hypothetical protein
MKTKTTLTIALLALGLSGLIANAQDAGAPSDDARPPRHKMGEGGPNGGGPGMNGHRPMPPVMGALDANHDGTIDADEIANASAALKKLDKNGDGKLTQEELRPPRPANQNGSGQDGPPPQHPPSDN